MCGYAGELVFAPKVFNIGFHKTGTSSMGRALQKLGYRVCGAVGLDEEGLNDERVERIAQAYLPDFDAFQDNPWAVLYPRLDGWCPGSKFILTVRSVESWIASATRNFGADSRPMLEWIARSASSSTLCRPECGDSENSPARLDNTTHRQA